MALNWAKKNGGISKVPNPCFEFVRTGQLQISLGLMRNIFHPWMVLPIILWYKNRYG